MWNILKEESELWRGKALTFEKPAASFSQMTSVLFLQSLFLCNVVNVSKGPKTWIAGWMSNCHREEGLLWCQQQQREQWQHNFGHCLGLLSTLCLLPYYPEELALSVWWPPKRTIQYAGLNSESENKIWWSRLSSICSVERGGKQSCRQKAVTVTVTGSGFCDLILLLTNVMMP